MAAPGAISKPMSWASLAGPNFAYALDLYDRYIEDPASVDEATRQWFETLGPPPAQMEAPESEAVQISTNASPLQTRPMMQSTSASTATAADFDAGITRVVNAQRVARNIREFGHLAAKVNPLVAPTEHIAGLDLATYGLSKDDLAAIPVHWIWRKPPVDVHTALEAIERLHALYTGSLGYDFAHVHDEEERAWLLDQVEHQALHGQGFLDRDAERRLLKRLMQVEGFERFLHRTFVGQKRFSIEGVDMLVPMLDEVIEEAVANGTRSVMIGMAHRGRLNVLAHVLRKPYTAIFSEFHAAPNKDLVPSEGSMGINYGWSGDVKYHMGARRDVREGGVAEAKLVLANNPSHLEFVNPVVEGYARALQDRRHERGTPTHDVNASLAIVVHGDAAFPGEGVVAETLNLSRLPGYEVGGTIHIIANNQVGFTAEPIEGRSTRYASDLAKGFDIPIVHVNADDAEACVAAVRLAWGYRARFHKDILIDLIGYRRWGHNEMDDPVMTQPAMYQRIRNHPTTRAIYEAKLVSEGVVTADEVKGMEQSVQQDLQTAYKEMKASHATPTGPNLPLDMPDTSETGIASDALLAINTALTSWPADFAIYDKVKRVLDRRQAAVGTESGKVDWAHAETLAFGSILVDGTPIRLTGQDSERGTFSQRHLVLHDEKTGERYCPLQHLPNAKASFEVYNSPLSEAAVIGFEYGYGVMAQDALVMWEGQFGDFANVGQVIIDQFLASGRAKWGQTSGLVMLLPHGYEGQGPEHSSGRLERFLQLSAENNWRVVNATTAAQYFHLLRSQAAMLHADPRPLIVMTPKSLLRNPLAASSPSEFTSGSFQPVLHMHLAQDPALVRRLVLCSGKVAVDLAAVQAEQTAPGWLDVIRVEQLYPLPTTELKLLIGAYPNLQELVWLQEEPANMGAWNFMEPRLRRLLEGRAQLLYVGRPARSSPAEGFSDTHEQVQRQIIDRVFAEPALSTVLTGGRG